MDTVILILLIAAFLCFVATAFGFGSSRINLLAAGLACWVLTALIRAIP